MLRLATDEDVNGGIIRGLKRRIPDIDLVRAQDALHEGALDPDILEWAAEAGRALITNDRSTMIGLINRRAAAGLPLPGIIVTSNKQSIGAAIDDILLIAERISEEELKMRVHVFLPY